MKITASIDSDYILNPSYGELNEFRSVFGLFARQINGGYTLSSYYNIDQFLIKDKEYIFDEVAFIAKETRSFKNKTLALRSLGLTVSIETGKFLNNKKGLINYDASYLEYSKLGFKVRQLPQIDASYMLNGGDEMVIIGINGDYDFDSKIFYGILDVISYDEYMRLKK